MLNTVKECMEAFVASFNPEKAVGYSRIGQYNFKDGKNAKGGLFHIIVQGEKASLHEGAHTKPDFEVTVDADTWVNICNGNTTPMLAAISGKMKSTVDRTEMLFWGECFPMKSEGGWALH